MSKYNIGIDSTDNLESDQGDGFPIVSATGSLKLVTAAAKEGLAAIKGQGGEFVATVIEVGNGDREVVRVRATEDIVTLVVNKRLKDEKAQQSDATPAATGQTEGAGEVNPEL